MRISDWSSDVCSSDLLLRSGRKWREAPDEGASVASCCCSSPATPSKRSKAALRCALAPSSALLAPSPVNGRRASWVGRSGPRGRSCAHERLTPVPHRSQERRVGTDFVITCLSLFYPSPSKTHYKSIP